MLSLPCATHTYSRCCAISRAAVFRLACSFSEVFVNAVMSLEPKAVFEFGLFRLNPAERLLLRGQTPVRLPPKAFDALLLLVENPGHLLEKEELLRKVWPGTFVEESNLAQHISILRKALQDGEGGFRYIETVPRRGYRFVAEVRELDGIAEQAGMGTDADVVPG